MSAFRPLVTHKYRNLRARPHASVMIDISRAGLNLKGVLIRGQVTLIEGDEGRQIKDRIYHSYISLLLRLNTLITIFNKVSGRKIPQVK
jgi:Pyridoxamine 5'-phosphate oxidase